MHLVHVLVVSALVLAIVSSLVIVADIIAGHPQHMMLMNFVYPITALYAGPLGLLVYFTLGRKSTRQAVLQATARGQKPPQQSKPFWQSVAVGALHCGSGCTLGDILAETLLFFFPLVWLGRKLYGAWLIDFIFAFIIGILFQYYAIKPMRKISAGDALKAALKADTLSLIAWQIGMYGWMAIATFLIFHHELRASDPMFWCMMQIGMLCGFLTAYPVNWWLLRKKIKETM